MDRFQLVGPFQPTGDQPQAIEKLLGGVEDGLRHQTLLGVTGSGKTFTLANVIARANRPTLVISHNKTLAAQLYQEFRDFFPHNAVEYFVSYYDYYQPEAYVPQIDLYIEKDATINQEIERLRNAATQALMTRRDVVIVASVSCIYGLGSPEDYRDMMVTLRQGEVRNRQKLLRQLIAMQYARTNADLAPGKIRVRGDVVEIQQSGQEVVLRVELWGDQVERLARLDPRTGEVLAEPGEAQIFPARHYMVSSEEKFQRALADIEEELHLRLAELEVEGKVLEAHRLEQRTRYDLEMLREMGYCTGIENYSRHLDQRPPGSAPSVLLDYFPDDFLLIIDESHMTVPQVRGMFHGDRSRKQTLVDFGFRLPSAVDNRPLTWEEFCAQIHQVIYVSATPGEYELEVSEQVVEQLLRPTGVLDPEVVLRPTRGQIDDLMVEIRTRVARGQRALVTTLTKRMAEDLADYLMEMGVKVHYLHAEVETLERVRILRDLRQGVYDVVVGINLLREGLDLPEVSLVAILDADKEGFLRSSTSLIQTIGRAARHVEGKVIMYADTVTQAMRAAIEETARRRRAQMEHNERHGIIPQSIVKEVRDITDRVRQDVERRLPVEVAPEELSREELRRLLSELEREMKAAAAELEFERAAALRDQILELRRMHMEDEDARERLRVESAARREAAV